MSDESTYFGLFLRVFDDLGNISPGYAHRKQAQRDREYVIRRYRAEGLAFLTKTLPSLAKRLETALEVGTFSPIDGFSVQKGRTTPDFLGYWFKELFDEKGAVLDSANGTAVGVIRQICYFMYKFDSDYPTELQDKVIKDFIAVDQSLTHCENIGREERLLFTIAGSWLFRVFRDFDPAEIRPRPGPGASASGTHRSKRYEPMVHYKHVHEAYPYYRYFYMSSDHLQDRRNAYLGMPRMEHPRSVLRLVPKDSRGPRIICMEEQELMFLQQGLGDAIRSHIESHPLTRGRVNFTDQTINGNLAMNSSVSREYATLDMKEASDRISRKLVEILFERLPQLRTCLLALSTPSIHLPDGGVLETKKFAPMGSSLCFPIMSVVHHALAVAAIHIRTALPTRKIAREVYVYGDDIIVRSEHAAHLFETFPLAGLMFNTGKSFVRGYFRESCGIDAFKGMNVSPQRLKRRFFDGRDPQNISAVMAMYSDLYERGYCGMAGMLRVIVESRYGKFPFVVKGSPFLGWTSEAPLKASVSEKGAVTCVLDTHADLQPTWDTDTQNWTVSARVIETEPEASMCGGWEQMMRSNLSALIGSARLDGRWSRKLIRYRRLPIQSLDSPASSWVPKVIVR